MNVITVSSCVKPVGDDELRATGLGAGRDVFGDFEEFKESGEVDIPDDFEPVFFHVVEKIL